MPARKAFEIVHAQLPSDAATLNNLGVIAWRQNQYMNSLGFYSDAMLALPANKEILNNVAEALAALKDNFKKTPNAQRTSRLFVEQEAQLEHVMSQYGWYRWGSMWIDKDELDALKKAEADVKGKLDKLYSDADDIRRKIRTNSDQITKDQDYINEIASENYVGDGINRTFVPTVRYYPDSYYQAQGELRSLQNDNQNLTNTLTQMGRAGQATGGEQAAAEVHGSSGDHRRGGRAANGGCRSWPDQHAATPQAANVAETPAAPATQPRRQFNRRRADSAARQSAGGGADDQLGFLADLRSVTAPLFPAASSGESHRGFGPWEKGSPACCRYTRCRFARPDRARCAWGSHWECHA